MWPAIIFLSLTAAVLLHFWWSERRNRRHLSAAQQEYTTAALRQQQQAIAQSRAQQQALFDSMIEGVLLLDNLQRVQMTNLSLRKMLQLADPLHNQPLQKMVRWDELFALIQRVVNERRVADVDLVYPEADQRWFNINGASITDGDNLPQGVLLVFHDITRLKQLENTRQDFVANVSHELRTPLSIIKGCVETLLEPSADDAGQRARLLPMIDRHADRLTYLIDDLLTISQLESGRGILNRQPMSLREAAQHALDDLAARAIERRTTLVNDVPAGLQILADADRLQQVFFNLIENAIKYGRTDGHINIHALTQGTSVEIGVHDDGPGIPPETASRVFERFFRADKARSRGAGGTGLGLAIVKHIVQSHGGQVRVESSAQHGTTFFFTLPLG